MAGAEVAKTLGIGVSMVSDFVNAKRNPPPPELLRGFGNPLGMSQTGMMEALGYLDPAPAKGKEASLEAAIPREGQDALAAIDWSNPEMVKGVACMQGRFAGNTER